MLLCNIHTSWGTGHKLCVKNAVVWKITCFQDQEREVAGYVLVFMIVGVNNNIKQALGYFATQTATSDVLFPLLWTAVALVEQAGLKVSFSGIHVLLFHFSIYSLFPFTSLTCRCVIKAKHVMHGALLSLVWNVLFFWLQCADCRKTRFVGLLIRSILRWKNCTRAEALVPFFPRKIERINRPARHVFLQSAHCNQKNRTFHTRLSKAPCITAAVLTLWTHDAIITSLWRHCIMRPLGMGYPLVTVMSDGCLIDIDQFSYQNYDIM